VENRDTDTADYYMLIQVQLCVQVQLRDVMRLLHALYFNVTDELKLENSVRLLYETNNWICLYHYDLDGRLRFAQLEAKFSCTSSWLLGLMMKAVSTSETRQISKKLHCPASHVTVISIQIVRIEECRLWIHYCTVFPVFRLLYPCKVHLLSEAPFSL
jgi:hypothetical protein